MPSTREEIEAHSDNPSGFLALNSGNDYYRADGASGVVAYRRSGRYLVQFGGAFTTAPDYDRLLSGFVDFAGRQRRRIVAIQLQRADAEIYARHGFTVNQVGASYVIALDDFSLRGRKFMQLRNKISRARRCGLEISEERPAEHGDPLAEVDRAWLRGKGTRHKELTFLIGERLGPYAADQRLFVGRIDGQVIGYISYSPVYGNRPGWLHDLTRRRPDAPPGVMEAVNAAAIETFRAEGCRWLHLGFTPFTGLDAEHAVDSGSPLVDRIIRFLATHGEPVYPARTQLAYKQKWGIATVLPEYVAFQGRPRPGAVWRLLRVTNSI
ncbi:DUF2156 domain-containing protein [Micromonospora sp. NBC_01699]|uniref:bifunctional lysylphosphatidylglycerol flippase/synthetase MprF n=1 Tax=Micromonospora sp. NBC_01699 TaxID=2975984 RepID=UPI002E2FBBFA|nr:DUF2156 domain-containing protein [Micromonospora sp. NBC_01699]